MPRRLVIALLQSVEAFAMSKIRAHADAPRKAA
jgi:hypothetical protein